MSKVTNDCFTAVEFHRWFDRIPALFPESESFRTVEILKLISLMTCPKKERVNVNSVTVRVPASTSNLGSGFDTLGLAVRLYQTVTLTRRKGQHVGVRSQLATPARAKEKNIVMDAACFFFQALGLEPFGFEAQLRSEIPIGRGLGASGAARAGIVTGLNVLAGTNLERHRLVSLVTSLEGHPDNASPALLGGFTVSGTVDQSIQCFRFGVDPGLKFVTLIPCFEIDTRRARELIPRRFSKEVAAHSLNRAALITAALASGQPERLRGLFDDQLHQPYREKLIPKLWRVIQAGEAAGAIGGWLSGSGSAIMCVTLDDEKAVAAAMQREMPEAEVKILLPDNRGATILRTRR